MLKYFNNLDKYIDKLGLSLIALNLFANLIISGMARMDQYGTVFNYAQFALLFAYCLAYCLFRRNHYEWKNPYFIMVCIFLFFSFVTIMLNPRKIDNAKITIITVVQWFVIFLYVKNHKKIFLKLLNVLNFMMFFVTLISLCLFVLNIKIVYGADRYAGIFANTNMGPALCCISIGMSIILFQNANKYKRVFLLFNIVVQILFVRLGMSRASLIVLYILIITFVFLFSLLYKKKWTIILQNVLLAILAVFIIYNYVGDVLIYARDSYLETKKIIETNKKASVTVEKTANASSKRDENAMERSNNYRMEMLKYGSMTVMKKPLFGQGIKNLPDAVREVAGKDLNGLDGGGVHNSYLQLLISNGIIGFLSFAAIHLAILYGIWKRRKKILAYCGVNKIIWFSGFFALYAGLLVYGLFESILIMNSAFVTSMFALVSGGLLDE